MTDATLRYEAAAERRARILSALRLGGFVSIADLARDLRVSQMTIRRDLHALEDRGHVRVVHGGASLAPSALRGSAFPDAHARSQERVARRAAGLVGASDTIAIDAGATAFALARALPEDFGGCVITHSMPVLQLLAERTGGVRMVSLGANSSPTAARSSARRRRPRWRSCARASSSSRRSPSTSGARMHDHPQRRACNEV